jgi:homoserine O-acetyltransferase/O-succinyltransferase
MKRHPPLQQGYVDAPHRTVAIGRFELEGGAAIDDAFVSCAVHGDLADDAKPVAVALCAIGSTHHRLDFLIGAGRALDPARLRIIAIDAIGNGLAISPSNSSRQPGMAFPRFGIRDMVRSQQRLLAELGVDDVDLVIGASMGGMQALQWGVLFPGRVRRIVAMTPMAKTAPWAVAVNRIARQGLLAKLQSARPPYAADVWDAWVPLMQLVAMRTPVQVAEQFATRADVDAWLDARIRWWTEQGFDPVDWLYQSWAYDDHDVGTTPGFAGDTARALASIHAPVLIATALLDLYNPVECAEWAAQHIPDCEYLRIDSPFGHVVASAIDAAGATELDTGISRFLGATGMYAPDGQGERKSPRS